MAASRSPGSPRVDRLLGIGSLAVLVIATLVSCLPFVAPGHPLTYDVWPHLSRIKVVAEALAGGRSPFYSFMFYSGYPMLRFYSPLFHLLGGALALLTGRDLLLALRVLLVLIQPLSAGAMFWFLRRRTGSTAAASLGAAVYVLAPWRVRHIAVLANYPMALLYVLLPVALLALERLAGRPGRRSALVLGLVLALLALSHIVYALFAVLLLAVAVASRPGGLDRRAGAWAGVAAAAALALSAFFVVPFATEYSAHVFPGGPAAAPPPDPAVLLGLSSATSGYTGGYFGASVIALFVAGGVLLLAGRGRRAGLPLLAGFGAGLVLTFVVPALGKGAAFLTLGLLPERMLLFSLFFGAAIVAEAWHGLEARIPGARRAVLLAAVFVVLSTDTARYHLGIRYHHPDRFLGVKRAIYGLIAAGQPSRTLDLNIPADDIDEPVRSQAYPGMGFVFGGLATPLGPHYHQFAPRAMLYAYPWVNLVAADLGDTTTREVSPDTRDALFMLGVSHLIVEPVIVPFEEAGTTYEAALVKAGVDWDTRYVEPGRRPMLAFGRTGAGLVLASLATTPMPPARLVRAGEFTIASDWRELLQTAGVDPEDNCLAAIPVPPGVPADSLPGPVSVRVGGVEVSNDRVRLRVNASGDCFLRLALSYYPELRVTLDGRVVEHRETADHFCWLRFPAGEHDIEVSAPLTPVRRWTLAFSAVALAMWVAGISVARRPSGQGGGEGPSPRSRRRG